ncbi:UNVERIFIED_CONTAM: hypothetical protein K2H54_038868 [Gekko kuhli]
MGRNLKHASTVKQKKAPNSVAGTPNSMKSFFTQPPIPAEAQTEENNLPKMVDFVARHDEDEAQTDELIISRQELVEIHKDLHRSLREAVEEIIQPINTRLNDFMTELQDTSKKADTNAAICTSLQEENLKREPDM